MSISRRVAADLQSVVAKHISAAGLKERTDVAQLNAGLQKDLAAAGMAFNQPDTTVFRDQPRKAGVLRRMVGGKYGDEAWAILERSVGTLA